MEKRPGLAHLIFLNPLYLISDLILTHQTLRRKRRNNAAYVVIVDAAEIVV